MSSTTLGLEDTLLAYLRNHSLREPEVLKQLREETLKLPLGVMQVSPEQGQFMALLVRITGATRIVEIGTFTGYSSLVMALALPDSGKLITCDISEDYTNTARQYWQKAGVADRIELKLAPALETLDALLASGQTGTFDMAFIDADKTEYIGYYERCLQLLNSGGLILVDNVLWGGRVARSEVEDSDTNTLRQFNDLLHQDERIGLSMLPLGDGLTIARKR
jgi:predicted O-methyltransferase YrrM